MADDTYEIYIDLGAGPVHAGVAYFHRRTAVTTTFNYTAGYLANRAQIALDPNLPLTSGAQYTDGLPGAFQDCAPDRWGGT